MTPTPGERVVVTGAGGQVGAALRDRLPRATLLTRDDLDVTDVAAVRHALAGASAVVHLAAYTDVDGCERDPDRAHAVNAEGTRHVVGAAADEGARVLYVSTDYVFDGEGDGPYDEDAAPAPLNAYGRSKLAGERWVTARPGGLVVRTSWVYGRGGNFVRSILRAAEGGGPLRVVSDQVGRPTSADDLARALVHLLEREAGGVVHVTGDGDPCSWADLAAFVLGSRGSPVAVEPVTTEEYRATAGRAVAPRPGNSVLSLRRARSLGVPLRDWREAVEEFLHSAALAPPSR